MIGFSARGLRRFLIVVVAFSFPSDLQSLLQILTYLLTMEVAVHGS